MARSPSRAKYYVRVARLRIETAIVEVAAENDDDAELLAIREATQLSATSWAIEPFDPTNYRPHVETMVTGDDFDPPIQLGGDNGAELLEETETRYLLLKASSDEDEGDVVLQPWFDVEQPDLLVSDLTRDWIASLQHLGVTHLSERLDDLASGSTPMPSDRILFAAPRQRKPPGEFGGGD
jgi:hypothetical protein